MLKKAGFTVIELMLVVLIAAVLATIGLPLYQQQVRKLRRADALTAIALIQQAQERYRSEQPRYAPMLGSGGLGLGTLSDGGHYQLATETDSSSASVAYAIIATARGPQADDQPCQVLRLDWRQGSPVQRSGPDTGLGNDAATNRRCWQP
jgi:type IV pilus assembly protein PilE